MNFVNEKAIDLPQAKIPDAAALLTRSFWDDPMTVFLYPDVIERRERAHFFYILNMEHAAVGGELYTTSSFKGIAVWRFFGDETRPKVDSSNDPRNRLPQEMGEGPFQRLMIITKSTNEMHKKLVQGQHCYLLFLAVEPGHQGEGIGGILIQPILKMADKKGLPCYLETMKERNLAFYRKHGFNVAGEQQIPDGGPYFWALRRTPGK